MLTGERMIVREAARYWWLFLVSGILWLLIAWLVLRLNATSIATVGVLLGVVFGLSGINEVGIGAMAPAAGRSGTTSWPSSSSWARCTASSGRSTPSSPWPRCWG
jgi:uncharacterized membrane protein HdeD (DUF308 family)